MTGYYETVCCNCNKHLSWNKGTAGLSHGLCRSCTYELYKDDFTPKQMVEILSKIDN